MYSLLLIDLARTTAGIRVVIAPSIGRSEGMKGLDDMVMNQNSINVMDLDIYKVEGSYKKRYLDTGKTD